MTGSLTKHIGIVGCSAEGAALCYRTICAEGSKILGAHAHPEISMHTPSLHRYVKYLDDGDINGIASLMLSSARLLAAGGADFLICPDNTIHQAFSIVVEQSPLPWLHIAVSVAENAKDRGFSKLGLTGTKWLVESSVYPDILASYGIEVLRPDIVERDLTNQIIMDELVYGVFKPESIAKFQAIITNLKDRGCDAVILGCTEIPLILSDENSPLPTLDSTRLLAKAAINEALK